MEIGYEIFASWGGASSSASETYFITNKILLCGWHFIDKYAKYVSLVTKYIIYIHIYIYIHLPINLLFIKCTSFHVHLCRVDLELGLTCPVNYCWVMTNQRGVETVALLRANKAHFSATVILSNKQCFVMNPTNIPNDAHCDFTADYAFTFCQKCSCFTAMVEGLLHYIFSGMKNFADTYHTNIFHSTASIF